MDIVKTEEHLAVMGLFVCIGHYGAMGFFGTLPVAAIMVAVVALCYWFLLPFDRSVRLALVILAVSPIGSAVPGFTEEMQGDAGLSCSINSLSILISIITIVTLLVTML